MKASHYLVALLAIALGALATTATAKNGLQLGEDVSRIRTGFRIAPVPLDLKRKNIALVGLGSYLVNAVAGCSECHTHPAFIDGANPFMGQAEATNVEQYLAGGRAFGPFIRSTNITPDEYGRPGGLDFAAFEAAIRTGRASDGSNRILQVMPWPMAGKMSTRDLRAIYEYLRAIPSLPDNPAPGP